MPEDKDLEAAASAISEHVPDAVAAESAGEIAIFTYSDLPAPAVEAVAEHGLSLDTPGLIGYTHTEKTVLGDSDDPMKATFLAK